MTHRQAVSEHFTLEDIAAIPALSQKLADYFPCPDQSLTGIYELLINAVEHGNLGIGGETKAELIRQNRWQEEIERRLALPYNRGKTVDIDLSCTEHECRLSITDQGNGFLWKNQIGRLRPDLRYNGRGLWIVFNSKFDRVIFNQAGNQVTCVVQTHQWRNFPLDSAGWKNDLRFPA
jgi:anti-sigma regulatory factor (Ser/Thr protein kinase)